MLGFERDRPPAGRWTGSGVGTTAGALTVPVPATCESLGRWRPGGRAAACGPRGLPLLVAADQEGGQLNSLGVGHDPVPGQHGAGGRR